jgi:tetratricopeptide (TPR) repeat protein
MVFVHSDDSDALVEDEEAEAVEPSNENSFDLTPASDVGVPAGDDEGVADTQAYDRRALLEEAAARPPVASRAPAAAIVPPPPIEKAAVKPPAPAAEAAPPDEEAEPEELAEAEFFIEQQLWSEAEEIIAQLRAKARTTSSLAPRVKALEQRLESARAAVPSEPEAASAEPFDLAAELEREVEAEPPAAAGGDDFQYSVEDVLREFKKGVERTVRPEDVETHYDLGIAYKEMGLLDEAIGEFELAAGGPCATEKGDLSKAADAYERALSIPGLRKETQVNLHFEVGVAREALGDLPKALAAFEKVAAIDSAYRDVAVRLAKVKAAKPKANGVEGPERPPPAGPAGKARKVGYL